MASALNFTSAVSPPASFTMDRALAKASRYPADDGRGELFLRAPRLALDVDVIGDDVGRVAGRLAVLAAEDAGIAGALPVGFDDLAEPAAALRFGQGRWTRPSVAEMPFSGATPACDALPVISTSQFCARPRR